MTEKKQRRKPRKYTDAFKQQLVDLYHAGKRRCDICREYDISTSLFDKWVKQADIFHTDRGNEFKNKTIEELLETFDMQRSLSRKGCPYDNAVAEATFKVIKTEFVWNETFHTLEELKLKVWDYIHWYNHCRIHSSLGYQTPVQYRKNNLKKVV